MHRLAPASSTALSHPTLAATDPHRIPLPSNGGLGRDRVDKLVPVSGASARSSPGGRHPHPQGRVSPPPPPATPDPCTTPLPSSIPHVTPLPYRLTRAVLAHCSIRVPGWCVVGTMPATARCGGGRSLSTLARRVRFAERAGKFCTVPARPQQPPRRCILYRPSHPTWPADPSTRYATAGKNA